MKKKIPNFQSPEEAALFWENHEVLDYINPNEFKVVHPKKARRFSFTHSRQKPVKQLISLRIDARLLEKAKQTAVRNHAGYQSILRGWLEKGAS